MDGKRRLFAAAAAMLLGASPWTTTAYAPQFGSVNLTFFGGAAPRGGEPERGFPASFGLEDAGAQTRFVRLIRLRTVLPLMEVNAIPRSWTFSNVRILSVEPPRRFYSAVVTFAFDDFTVRAVPLPPAVHMRPGPGEPAFLISPVIGRVPIIELASKKQAIEMSDKVIAGVDDKFGARRLRRLLIHKTALGTVYIDNFYGKHLIVITDAYVGGYDARLYKFPMIA